VHNRQTKSELRDSKSTVSSTVMVDGYDYSDEIAVVVPVYMSKATLGELCRRLIAVLETITQRFAIILVDDGSPDQVWSLIRELGAGDSRIKGIRLTRNFGQHYALTAGIDYARARWYCVMDCDLQHAPEDILGLYAEATNGYQIVAGVFQKKGQGLIERALSRLFYVIFNMLAGTDLEWNVGNFCIFSDRVAVDFRQMREQMRFFPASLRLMGYETGTIALQHHPRQVGASSYTFWKLAKLAGNAILAHSQTPLKVTAAIGFSMSLVSFLIALALIARKVVWDIPVIGWTSLIVSIFVVGGMQIFVTGVVGIYVGKCFEEVKKRPLYFVEDTSNL